MVSQINIAVIGAGYWGYKLIKEYLSLSKNRQEVKLAGVVDISKQRLKQIAKELNLPKTILYTNIDQILTNNNIDAVHIATPNETHYQIATKSLQAGKHVLLEKPMTLSSREAFKLAREAEQKNQILLIGHIYRFNHAVTKTRKLLKKDIIGKPRYIEIRWTTNMPPPPNRDIIFDLAPHPIDIINYLFDDWPTRVYALAKSYIRKTPGKEETAFILAELPEEQMISIALSWIHPGPKTRTYTIVGEKGTIHVNALTQQITIFDENNNPKQIPVNVNNTIKSMINHFINCITNNDAPENSALIGAITVTILEAMTKSLKQKTPIEIFPE